MDAETITDIDTQVASDIRAVIEAERGALGVCPLFGRACIGPVNCAPARFHADYLLALSRAESIDPATEPRPHEVCPIVRLVDGVSVAAQALLPLLLGPEPSEAPNAPPAPIPEAESPEERVIRERNAEKLRVLGGVKVDQHAFAGNG